MGTFRQETLFGRWCGSVTAGGSKEFLASPSARTMHKESCLTQDAPPPAIWCKAAPFENRLAAIWEDALSPKTSPKVCDPEPLGRRQRLPERPLPRRAFRASERQDNMSYLNSRLAHLEYVLLLHLVSLGTASIVGAGRSMVKSFLL